LAIFRLQIVGKLIALHIVTHYRIDEPARREGTTRPDLFQNGFLLLIWCQIGFRCPWTGLPRCYAGENGRTTGSV